MPPGQEPGSGRSIGTARFGEGWKSSRRGRRTARLGRDLLLGTRVGKGSVWTWGVQGPVAREDHGDALCHRRGNVRAARARLAFKLASAVKDKKGFFRCINSKRRLEITLV